MINRKARLERGAAPDLWRNTLSQIPAVLGRLVYLSALREPNTGKYQHHGLALVFGKDEADHALRQSHSQGFAEWLCFNLEQQKADLDLYLSGLLDERRVVVANWLRLAPYRNLIPASATTVQSDLFLLDFVTLLELLRNECGVDAAVPDA